MKNTLLFSLLLLSLSLVALNACKTPCEDYCENGYCLTGDCDCLLGWKGEACNEIDSSYTPNNTEGYVSFFQTVDINCGYVTVSVSQDGQMIDTENTSNFLTDVENCYTSGCANMTLEIGKYAYRASDTCGTVWEDSITIAAKSCDRIILN